MLKVGDVVWIRPDMDTVSEREVGISIAKAMRKYKGQCFNVYRVRCDGGNYILQDSTGKIVGSDECFLQEGWYWTAKCFDNGADKLKEFLKCMK